MGWFDILSLALLGFLAFKGYRRGLVGQIFGFAGAVISLVAAFSYFSQLGGILARFLPLGEEISGILGFILIAAAGNGIFAFAASRWRALTKSTAVSLIDSLAGAAFGALKGLLILVAITVILVSIPLRELRDWVETDPVAGRVLRAAPLFYLIQERSLPPNVPRLLVTSQGVQLRRVNFAALDGATCLACCGRVKYQGFVRQGLLSYPCFICTKCGLKSDGCLTYQGYHLIYGQCPLDKANSGQIFNCRVWPSARPVAAKGPCPVCGQP